MEIVVITDSIPNSRSVEIEEWHLRELQVQPQQINCAITHAKIAVIDAILALYGATEVQ